MTFEQFAIMGILSAMLLVYASERFRVEMVAMAGLAAAFLLGVVPPSNLFAGFSSPAVLTVIEILLIVSSLAPTPTNDNFTRCLASRRPNTSGVMGGFGA